jgi:hypothetical protein
MNAEMFSHLDVAETTYKAVAKMRRAPPRRGGRSKKIFRAFEVFFFLFSGTAA